MPAQAYTDALPGLRARFAQWLAARRADEKIVVFCHFDADGLAAGALLGEGLGRLGYTRVAVVPSGRGESAFSEEARARLAALNPDALVVTDLGVHAEGVLPGVPTLYVDHHQPAGLPPAATILTGYGLEPLPCSAWLAYDLLAASTAMEDRLWVAAVGIVSDLGDKAAWPALDEAKKTYTASALKDAVALTNAARRASAFDVARPLALLERADGPRAFREDAALAAYRAEVNAAVQEARKAAPLFSATEPFALVRLHSACQIHPLLAQQWRGRLPRYAPIAANTGYLPGLVAFSARTHRRDLNLPQRFRAVELGAWNGRIGFGHDRASGGHLPPAVFNLFLDALGFGPDAHVSEDG